VGVVNGRVMGCDFIGSAVSVRDHARQCPYANKKLIEDIRLMDIHLRSVIPRSVETISASYDIRTKLTNFMNTFINSNGT
jgi:hypothetical protein